MHPATQEVERRVEEVISRNPQLYSRRTVLKAVQAQMQLELLHDISKKLDTLHQDNNTPEAITPIP